MDSVGRLKALELTLAEQGESSDLLLQIARTWRRLGNHVKARHFAERALRIDSGNSAAWNTLGVALMDDQAWDEAEKAFLQALRGTPPLPIAEQNLALALRQQTWQVQEAAQHADWSVFNRNGKRLLTLHRNRMDQQGSGIVTPFSVLGFFLSAEEQRDAAVAQAGEFLQQADFEAAEQPSATPMNGRRMRIGYLSADFRNNAAGHLLHQLFAEHDRNQFEVYGLSYGPEDGSEFRRIIRQSLEQFVELRDLSDESAAARIRALKLDLIVDLMGFAGNHRAGILARRPAPVQALWLGYCMTTGAPWIDWFVADRITIPEGTESNFTERLAFMPSSYQVYSGQHFDRDCAAREEYGLPESATVYCCFNMPEKIDLDTWSVWMNILTAVPDSVLWLLCGDEQTIGHYRKRAGRAGVDPARIIPAPLLPKRQHLERLTCADLFLDTPLCNAHTTASDALWAGVPVLTCPGELFAQRVAASVCNAAGLPDFVVDSMDSYKQAAISLGQDRPQIETLKQKLTQQRRRAPLFDVGRFAQDLEQQFIQMTRATAPVLRHPVDKKLPLVVVLGTWRSGTSALAGVLNHLGVHFGEQFGQLRHPTEYPNTFEAADLFPIVWSSIKEPEMEVLRPTDDIKQDLASWIEQHNEMAREAGRAFIGIKHPALSLLLPQFHEAWPNVLAVRTQRRLDECLKSMAKLGWDWPEDLALQGLERQDAAASKYCQGPTFEFPAFLEDPANTVALLCEFLSLKPSEAQRAAASASLSPKL